MSLSKKLNFVKGWPNPHINEFVGKMSSGQTALEGAIAHRNSSGQWVLGVSAQNQLPYVLWNGADGDGDQGFTFSASQSYQQTDWGGIQGVGFDNPIEFQTTRYSGTPVFGDSLYADTDGILKICAGSASVSNKVIVATVTVGVTAIGGLSFITVVPDNSRRVTS